MSAEKHYCKNCTNLVYGICAVHKSRVSGHTRSTCADFLAGSVKDVATQRERRKQIEQEIAERVSKNRQVPERKYRALWPCLTSPVVVKIKRRGAKASANPSKMAITDQQPDARLDLDSAGVQMQSPVLVYPKSKRSVRIREPRERIVYAMSIQDDALVDRYLALYNDRDSYREKLELVRNELEGLVCLMGPDNSGRSQMEIAVYDKLADLISKICQ